MKRIILSLAVIAVVAVVAVGATRAYFSDTATISGNTFTAGTMDLKIDTNRTGTEFNWENQLVTNQGISGLYPGYPANNEPNEQVIDILNQGSVNGTVTFDLDRTTTYNELSKYLTFDVYYSEHAYDTAGTFGNTPITSGSVSDFITSGPIILGNLTSYTEANKLIGSIKIVWKVAGTATNDIAGQNAAINAVFGLEQFNSPSVQGRSVGWAVQ